MTTGLTFASCVYFATGEGITICLLATFPHATDEDYDPNHKPSFTEKGFDPGVIITSPEDRVKRRFKEIFGDWYTIGIEFHTEAEFLEKYEKYLPPKVMETLLIPDGEHFPMFEYYSCHHENWS